MDKKFDSYKPEMIVPETSYRFEYNKKKGDQGPNP